MSEQYFYGHGKLLLTGEYFVLEGAKALGLPTKLGQRMHVKYRPSNNPVLYWKSYDVKGECWLDTKFEGWHFNCLADNAEDPSVKNLQTILRQAREQNIHFFRENVDVHIETVLEFPLNWGLGSSSTLIYNIAQWAFVSPFELQTKTMGGSGYDIACAQSMGPITYQRKEHGPSWETVSFNPPYKEHVFFVYLGRKQNSQHEVKRFLNMDIPNKEMIIARINEITQDILNTVNLEDFEESLLEHENLLSKALKVPRLLEDKFPDYWGVVKSLGAWGGDFALVTSKEDLETTQTYFHSKGYEYFYTFDEMILQNFEKFEKQLVKKDIDYNELPN